jgi:hypothetical protein
VGLDELVGADGVAQDLLELLATILLNLTGTVGEEDVRDLDAELVVSVEDLEGLLTLGDQTVTVDEDTVNVKGESHVLSLGDLLSLEVLDLGDEEVPGRLDRGHAGPGGAAVGMVNGGEARLTLAGDGQSGTEGVSGRSSVPHGRRHAEVVHVLGRLRDGRSGGRDLLRAVHAVAGNGEAVAVLNAGHLAEGAGRVGNVKLRVLVGGHVEGVE